MYASHRYGVVAARWRAQLAENAKALAFHHPFPEANHNELVGWVSPKPLLRRAQVVMLRAADDHPRAALQMTVARDLLRALRVPLQEVTAPGRGLLARLLSLILLGDLVSVYLAVLYRQDPTPVERIRRLKLRLART
jgi:glucose/mannose-6-phosphate isomerase